MKAYTDIEQSKKLAKILPLESADMCYGVDDDTLKYNDLPWLIPYHKYTAKEDYIPCWSLVALLNVLPKGEYKDTDLCFGGYKGDKYISEWVCSYEQQEPFIIKSCHALNPIDACYEMIVKLHEQKLL